MDAKRRGIGVSIPAGVTSPDGRLMLSALWRAFSIVVLIFAALSSGRAHAADQPIHLIMVEETGCRYCRQWEADIGHAYSQTPEGRFAPIRRVKRDAREVRGLKPVIYTPTFIVMRGGEELGRVTGYPGKDYFWPELDEILSGVGFMRGL